MNPNHLEAIMRRLPDSFRFSPPGRHVQIIAYHEQGLVVGYRMQLGTSSAGRTITLSANKYGGPKSCYKLALAIAARCGLTHDEQKRAGPPHGEPTRSNTSGAGNIQFRWSMDRQTMPTLHVVAYRGTANSGLGVRSFSVELHGLEGALDAAIAVRNAAGYQVDRAKLLARLTEMYQTKPAMPG